MAKKKPVKKTHSRTARLEYVGYVIMQDGDLLSDDIYGALDEAKQCAQQIADDKEFEHGEEVCVFGIVKVLKGDVYLERRICW